MALAMDSDAIRSYAGQHEKSASDAAQLNSALASNHEQLKATLDPQSGAALDESFHAISSAYTSMINSHHQYATTLKQIAQQVDELKQAAQQGFRQIHTQ